MNKEYWIEGKPATFATNGEKPWKEKILQSLNGEKNNFEGIEFDFVINQTDFQKYELDIDNLCEPVFSVLTSSLGCFNGKRKNIGLWTARKRAGKSEGLYNE